MAVSALRGEQDAPTYAADANLDANLDANMDANMDADADFLRESYLAFLVPLATDGRLEQALQACRGSPQDLIESTEDRESLFFDEMINVYFILRTPYQKPARLQSYLDRLLITLEAEVKNSSIPGRESPPMVEVIFSGAVQDVTHPLAVISDPGKGEEEEKDKDVDERTEKTEKSDESESESEREDENNERQKEERGGKKDKRSLRQTYIVWKLPVLLVRPRARLHAPTISLSAAASLRPPPAASAAASRGLLLDGASSGIGGIGSYWPGLGPGYLRSREPSSLNLLAPLESSGDSYPDSDDSRPKKIAQAWPPRLSAQRVSSVPPAALAMEQQQQKQQKQQQQKKDHAGHPSLTTQGHRRLHSESGRGVALRGQNAIVLRIMPAVHVRVRFVRPSTVPTSASVVGVLEVDFTPYFDCEAVLTRVEATLRGGEVVDLNGAVVADKTTAASPSSLSTPALPPMAPPLYCVARDHLTFLYRLSPPAHGFDAAHNMLLPPLLGGKGNGMPASPSRDLDLTVEARLLVVPGVCEPTLRMAWATTVDFTLPVNPGFGTALTRSASLQRAHRPSQLSIDGMASFLAPAVSRPDALPSLEAATARNMETTIPDFGITMTFCAPDHPVYAGEEFCWTVFVVNRASGGGGGGGGGARESVAGGPGVLSVSGAHGAHGAGGPLGSSATPPRLRKLALLALPKRRRNDVRVLRPPSMSGRPRAGTGLTPGKDGEAGKGSKRNAVPADADTADAVLDENVVHAMQRSSLVDSTDVLCLSADTRVGPLAPHACHVVELRFVALRAGAVGIEAVRVIDLGSQEHVDVRELPAMMILESRGGKPVE